MRAHTLVMVIIVSLCLNVPLVGRAAVSDPFIYHSNLIGMPTIPGASYGTFQTAVRFGDTPTLRVLVHSDYAAPSVSAGLSDFGLSDSATTSGKWAGYGAQYYPAYFYDFGPLSIGSAMPDGLYEIPITATNTLGSTTMATTSILLDSSKPTISLSNITFSTTSPRTGDYMYLSGAMSGTGSIAKVGVLKEALLDVNGNPLFGSHAGYIAVYDGQPISSAVASSTNGTFTRVPIQLFEGGSIGEIARAAFFKIYIEAYDEAGNFASTSLTVPAPKPLPPDPCSSGGCVSNVLFLPGIEASRLAEDVPCADGVCSTKLWEPSGDALASRLAHDASGASVETGIYATSIIDNAYVPIKGNIYKSFIEQMNSLTSAGALNAWEAIPYDWRLAPDQILSSGALIAPGKVSYLAATSSPYIIQELKRLAASSKTGKVTIIAHSNGGLITKALTNKLGVDAGKYIDKIIFVAVPQAGTPQAVGALLHGYDQGLPITIAPYALSSGMARTLATNMPMTYNLLPSTSYFTQVDDPVATFTNQPLLADFRARYGDLIHSQERLHTFITDSWRVASSTTEGLNYPSVGNEPLLAAAEALHTGLDAWTPPAGISLYEIAGWGEKTLAGIDYYQGVAMRCTNVISVLSGCTRTPKIDYRPRLTLDGDGTVVIPSALWTPGAKRYWVDLKDYNGFFGTTKHASILEVPQLRGFIQNLLTKNGDVILPQYISTTTPINSHPNPETELHFTLHSPLSLNLYDDQGRHTGVSTTTGEIEENIPESRYLRFGEVQFISAPASLHTRLVMNGYAAGSFTLDAEEVNGKTVIASTTFAGVPSAANTIATMDFPEGGLANAGALVVDENNDGLADLSLTPRLGAEVTPDITPPELQITFSTTTRALTFVGTDDSGSVIVTATTTYPTLKKDKKERKEDREKEEKSRSGIATTTVTARDAAGNTTTLVYTEQLPSPAGRDAITLQSLAYNGATTTLARTKLQYKWKINKKGNYSVFAAYLKTASSTVEAHYQPKKNVTTIMIKPQELDDRDDDEEGSRPVRNKLPGLVIPGLLTEKGSVKIIQ
ncbi:MAG: hypothetical protein KGH56_03860 [Patescibacteria group bacterium]|nr:hypothetical protein [Patescibacteria group bacterium]